MPIRDLDAFAARQEAEIREEHVRLAAKAPSGSPQCRAPLNGAELDAASILVSEAALKFFRRVIQAYEEQPMRPEPFDWVYSLISLACSSFAKKLWAILVRGIQIEDPAGRRSCDEDWVSGPLKYQLPDWHPARRVEITIHAEEDLIKATLARCYANRLEFESTPTPVMSVNHSREPEAERRRYPGRAAWLDARLKERQLTASALATKYGQLDHKSIARVQRGEPVLPETLEKLANALSSAPLSGTSKRTLILPADIPED
jgi:hypothetical protein